MVMRRALLLLALVSGRGLATDEDGGAVGGAGPDAGSPLLPPDDDCPAYDGGGMLCLGSFEVRNFADIDLVSSCAHITGDLALGANGLIEIELPLLERVDGSVTVVPAESLERILLPELKEVGGSLGGNPVFLDELAVPLLRTVGGDLRLPVSDAAPGVSVPCLDAAGSLFAGRVAAPRLTAIAGDVAAGLDAALLTRIPGALVYQPGANLPELVQVGDLSFVGIDSISLPALRIVDRNADLGCGGSQSITALVVELPSLVRAGTLHLCPWPALTSVELPMFFRILGPASLGGMTIGASATLGPVDAPALSRINGNLVLDGALSAPALSSITGDVHANHSIDLPGLVTITGQLRLQVQNGTMVFPSLTTVTGLLRVAQSQAVELRAPLATSIGTLSISDNPALEDIDFASLGSDLGALAIRRNPQLPTCQAIALRDQLIAAGWTGSAAILGNGDGSCP